MNSTFIWFDAVSAVLLAAAVTALVVSAASLIATVVRWKSDNRRRHMARFLIPLAAIPLLIGAQQAVQWLVFLPALGCQQMAEVNEARAERLANTSVLRGGDADK